MAKYTMLCSFRLRATSCRASIVESERLPDKLVRQYIKLLDRELAGIEVPFKGGGIGKHPAVFANQFLATSRRRNLSELLGLPAQYIQPIEHSLLIERHFFSCGLSSQGLNPIDSFSNISTFE